MKYIKEVFPDGTTKSVRVIIDDNYELDPGMIEITQTEYQSFIKPNVEEVRSEW